MGRFLAFFGWPLLGAACLAIAWRQVSELLVCSSFSVQVGSWPGTGPRIVPA